MTAPRRTIEDLERSLEPYLVRRAKRQAEFMRYELRLPSDGSRSDLESDFLWRQRMLAVETDFFDYHRGSVAFEDDHERELHLRRLGYTVHRYTGDCSTATRRRLPSSWAKSWVAHPGPAPPSPPAPLHKVHLAWPPRSRSSS